jgi:hypothetical protein
MTGRALAAGVAAALLLAPAITAADAVLDWNEIMVRTVGGQNPFAQARFAAITHLAVFEAVNAVTGHYEPYLSTIAAPDGASAEAAAVAAAHAVLRSYFPGAAADLDAARDASLAAIPDGAAEDDGIAVGEAAAAALLSLRADDGSAPPRFHMPASSAPGEWQLTPGCPAAGGLLLHWRNVTPFGILTSQQFRSFPPPALGSAEYARDYREVRRVGGVSSTHRPPDRADVALFYNAVLAVGVWNPVARQVAAARRDSLSRNARALALLNMAISDGLVSVMETKYEYRLWRPETAIRAGASDGNPATEPDPAFVPFLATPCFPSYGSAHAAASYAARRVLERLYGGGHHSLSLSAPSLPGLTLYYTRFREITADIDDARVYGGIHFRFDQEAGARQGTRIGAYVYRENLRPVHRCRDHGFAHGRE